MSGTNVGVDPPCPNRPIPVVAGSASRAKVILALGLAALVALSFWLVFTAGRAEPTARRAGGVPLLTFYRPFPAGGRYTSDPYIGSQVCSECHPGEASLHSRCGHDKTLRPVGLLPLARRLDGKTVADPEFPEVSWGYRFRDGQLHLARKEGSKVEDCILEYAFGTGHHAITFVSVIDPEIPAVLEHRMSYYPERDTVGVTPGHISFPRPPGLTAHGWVQTPEDARRCFACHATEISIGHDQRIDETMMIPNVSCERCHGPGRAHVAAARSDAPEAELVLPFGPNRWTADSLMAMCGSCHRHPSDAGSFVIRPEELHLVRFQPVGMMQSKCYLESGGTFSCVTCHDPHSRASTDRASYDLICMSCHDGRGRTAASSSSTAGPADRPLPTGAQCPVSPGNRCVECHMPKVDTGLSMYFSDHWIRVRRQ